MSQPVLARLTSILRVSERDVHAAYWVGSRVYGTAGPTSDEDFVVVLSKPGQRQDLAFAPGVNVVVHGVTTFQAALDSQSVFALECHFAPVERVVVAPRPSFQYKLDRKKLAMSSTEKSKSDWQKAKKQFIEEPAPSRKKIFHALRVPMFAVQIAKTAKLTDFACANDYYHQIQSGPDDDFDWYEQRFGMVRDELCAELLKPQRKQ